MDRIEIERLRLTCIVGILPAERRAPQPLEVGVTIGLDLARAGDSGDLAHSVDYAAVASEVAFLAVTGRWQLLESLGVAIARHLLAPPHAEIRRAPIDSVTVTLCKPEILGGRAVPRVIVEREAAWASFEPRPLSAGCSAEVLCELADVGAYRVHIDEGFRWTPPEGTDLHVLPGTGGRHLLAVAHPPFAR